MKKRSNRAITALLVAALALTPAKPVKAQEVTNKTVVEICVAVIVIGVGVYVVLKLKKICDDKLGPPNPPGQGTNNPVPPPPRPPPKTNHMVPISQPVLQNMTELDMDEDITEWDISSYGYTDPDGQPYLVMFGFGLDSSTNISTWQSEGTVTGWVSPNWVVTVGYTNGIPANTNWTVNTIGCTNTINLPIPASRSRFFRTVTQ